MIRDALTLLGVVSLVYYGGRVWASLIAPLNEALGALFVNMVAPSSEPHSDERTPSHPRW